MMKPNIKILIATSSVLAISASLVTATVAWFERATDAAVEGTSYTITDESGQVQLGLRPKDSSVIASLKTNDYYVEKDGETEDAAKAEWVNGNGVVIANKSNIDANSIYFFNTEITQEDLLNFGYLNAKAEEDAEGNPVVDSHGDTVYQKDEKGNKILKPINACTSGSQAWRTSFIESMETETDRFKYYMNNVSANLPRFYTQKSNKDTFTLVDTDSYYQFPIYVRAVYNESSDLYVYVNNTEYSISSTVGGQSVKHGTKVNNADGTPNESVRMSFLSYLNYNDGVNSEGDKLTYYTYSRSFNYVDGATKFFGTIDESHGGFNSFEDKGDEDFHNYFDKVFGFFSGSVTFFEKTEYEKHKDEPGQGYVEPYAAKSGLGAPTYYKSHGIDYKKTLADSTFKGEFEDLLYYDSDNELGKPQPDIYYIKGEDYWKYYYEDEAHQTEAAMRTYVAERCNFNDSLKRNALTRISQAHGFYSVIYISIWPEGWDYEAESSRVEKPFNAYITLGGKDATRLEG